MKQRIIYLDLLKLFTIFLVLWGHAIMQFQPKAYESSVAFNIIYAFHMPLFMALSGYFAVSSMSLKATPFFSKKFQQLLLPCLSWAIVCGIMVNSGLLEGTFHPKISDFTEGWLGIKNNFWFLKSCFLCYAIAWACYQFGPYKRLAFGFAVLLCLTQGRFNIGIMFPCFVAGMWFRKNERWKGRLLQRFYIPILLFLLLLPYRLVTHEEGFFYNIQEVIGAGSPVAYLSFALQRIYHIALGLSGALGCFALFHLFFSKQANSPICITLAKSGGVTLGVYILQAIILEVLMPRYINLGNVPSPAIDFLMPVMALAVLVLCLAIIKAINHSRLLAYLLLGKK